MPGIQICTEKLFYILEQNINNLFYVVRLHWQLLAAGYITPKPNLHVYYQSCRNKRPKLCR